MLKRTCKYQTLLSFILVGSILIIFDFYVTIYKLHREFYFYQHITSLVNKDKNEIISTGCSPLTSKKQFYTTIDGEIYPKYIPLFANTTINFECLNSSKNIKKILFWNDWFGDSTWAFGIGKISPFVKYNCPVTSCEMLNDRTRVNESDYVLIHMWDQDVYEKIPENRPSFQRWIMVMGEPPHHSPNMANLNNVFNLTATYRLDSDFVSLYYEPQKWTNKEEEEEEEKEEEWDEKAFRYSEKIDYLRNKTQLAAGIISNCGGPSNRLGLIRSLQKFISVDVYGSCGKQCPILKSPSGSKHERPGGEQCKYFIAKEYKFYFSFENNICKDYVTEKFLTILKLYPIIPVVLGGADYSYYVFILVYFI